MSRLKRRAQNVIPETRKETFSVLSLRNPSDAQDFARFVTDINTRFDAIAEKFAKIEPNLIDPNDYVAQEDFATLLEAQFEESDAELSSEGVDDIGAKSTSGRSSRRRRKIDEAVQELVDAVEDTGVVFGAVDGSGVIKLTTDATNFQWDNTNKRLGIGTTPGVELHVLKSSAAPVIKLESTAAASSEPRWDIIGKDGGGTTLWGALGVKGGAPFQNAFVGTVSTHDFEIRTNNAQRVLIGASTGYLNLIQNGAEATPSFHLGSDSDTGLWHPAANTLAVSCNTAEVMRWGATSVTINEDGDDRDFRVEGDTLPNLLLVEAGTDLVYVTDAATGGTAPTVPTGGFTTGTLLAVQNNSAATDNAAIALIAGATSGLSLLDFGDADDANAGSISYDHSNDVLTLTAGANAIATFAAGEVIINEDSDDVDFRVESNGAANMLFVEGGTDRVGVNQATPTARLHVTESSTSAAIPVAQLDQADVDEPFVKFLGTAAAATLTNSLVAVADVSTATVVGYAKIEIQDDGNQITDGDYYVAAYSLA